MTSKNLLNEKPLTETETQLRIHNNETVFKISLRHLFNACSRGDLEITWANALIDDLKRNGLGQDNCGAGSLMDDYDYDPDPIDEVIFRLDADIKVRQRAHTLDEIFSPYNKKLTADEFYAELCHISEKRFLDLADIFEQCDYTGKTEQTRMAETIQTLFPDYSNLHAMFTDVETDEKVMHARCQFLVHALREFDHS